MTFRTFQGSAATVYRWGGKIYYSLAVLWPRQYTQERGRGTRVRGRGRGSNIPQDRGRGSKAVC